MKARVKAVIGLGVVCLGLCVGWWVLARKEEDLKGPGRQMRNAARLRDFVWAYRGVRGVYPERLEELVSGKVIGAEEFEELKFRAARGAVAENWRYKAPVGPGDVMIVSPRVADPGWGRPVSWIMARADGSAERFGAEKGYRLPGWAGTGR